MKNIKTRFSERLLNLLADREIKQADLAREVGVKPQYINSYLKGTLPEPETLVALATNLGVSVDYLLIGQENAHIEIVPLLGCIPAGPLKEAIENKEDDIRIPRDLLPTASGPFFALRVAGESMTCAGIVRGSVVVVHHQPTVENGDIAAVIWGGDATLKYFYRHPEYIILQPANPCYTPTFIPKSRARNLKVVGKHVLTITTSAASK